MPAKGGYTWDFDNPPVIEAHSLLKHELLRKYLIRYFHVTTVDRHIDIFRIVLVDAFAGGGVYERWDDKKRHEGSPLIMMRAVRQAEEEINRTRTKPVVIEPNFFFFEKSDDGVRCLSRMLRESDVPYQDKAEVRQGDFQDLYLSLIAEIVRSKRSKVLFLLDQYGYSDVAMAILRTIFHLFASPEVMLTFAVDALIDYWGNSTQKPIEDIGLSQYIPIGDELHKLKLQKNWRREFQARIIRGIYLESGANFYTPFMIGSSVSSRAYCFIHLSKHVRARDVMMEHHWNNPGRFFHYGDSGLHMFIYDPKKDSSLTGQLVFQFDDDARSDSLAQLADDLPRHIYDVEGRSGVTFIELLSKKFNDTPATVAMLRDAFEPALRSQDIQIIGKNGEVRRKASAMKSDDRILPNPQLRLKLW